MLVEPEAHTEISRHCRFRGLDTVPSLRKRPCEAYVLFCGISGQSGPSNRIFVQHTH